MPSEVELRRRLDRLDEILAIGSLSGESLGFVRYERLKTLFVLREHDLVGSECLELWDEFPWRAEPLFLAARFFHSCGKSNLARVLAEEGLTLTPSGSTEWPLDDEMTGIESEVFYADLLVQTGLIEDAIAHYAGIIRISRNDGDLLSALRSKIDSAAERLNLCTVNETI